MDLDPELADLLIGEYESEILDLFGPDGGNQCLLKFLVLSIIIAAIWKIICLIIAIIWGPGGSN